MKEKYILIVLAILSFQNFCAQSTTVSSFNTLIKANHNFGLTNPVFDENSPMTYDPSQVDALGAAFSLVYTNQGGTSFDGYPSGTVGGFKVGSTYYPGNVEACGMPVQIKDLTDKLRINWKTSQQNANDIGDKWWATINVIFDGGTETSAPDLEARDYDLVIQNVSYEQDDFSDLDNPGGRYWYFARETPDGPIKPFTVYLDGVAYSWAVRYKFFDYPIGHADFDKNDKVHIKFIPIDNKNPIPFLDHSLKQFIDCTKEYIAYLPLSPEEDDLANLKVADENLWIKSIAAGYEIYEGSATLANDYFYTTIDKTAPNALSNLNATEQSANNIVLNWEDSTDPAFDTYTVYRSENGGSYNAIASGLRTATYIDTSALNASNYLYYVTVTDRSFNESNASNIAGINIKNTALISIDDAHVRNGTNADTNYGTAQNIQIRETTVANNNRQAYLKFDVNSINNITSAILRVNNTGSNGAIDVSKVADDNWSENTITWNIKPTIGTTIGTYQFDSVGTFDIDVTDYVLEEWQGDKIVSFGFTGSTTNYMTIASKESNDAPKLIITYDSDSTLSLEEDFKDDNNIVIYPNPTTSNLHITIKNPDLQTGKIEIYDSLGRLVNTKKTNHQEINIDLIGTAGMYLVKVYNKNTVHTKRVIKL